MLSKLVSHCAYAVFLATAVGYHNHPGVFAADYPERPLRLIVPFPSGGGVDIVARLISQPLIEGLKTPVVVDNRPGAAGTLGTDLAAKATPDGYTLLLGSVGPLAFSPTLYKKLPYNPAKDFAPISLVAVLPNVLLAAPSAPFRTVRELIAVVKKRPGQMNYASAGSGTPPHLAMELFKTMASINIVHVPYKGGPPALNDLMGGRVQVMFINILTALPFVQAARLQALAVSTTERSPVLPEVPTMEEAGSLPGFAANDWFGIVVPAGTPKRIIAILNKEFVNILSTPAVRLRLSSQGAEPITNTPTEFTAFIKTETAKWANVINAAGARAD